MKIRSQRLMHKVRVKVDDDKGNSRILYTRDFSDSGVFIFCNRQETPKIGSRIIIKALDIEGTKPQAARVMRIDLEQGFAAQFIEQK